MTSHSETHEGQKLADRATLSLLAALEDDEQVTQRGLAARIGVALGLTNSLLKRAVRKGLVKVGEAPAKRFAYYVTPKGFSEKSRLVAEYLTSSLTFFRRAREEYLVLFQDIRDRGHNKVALVGTGELAEIALLSAQETGVELYCAIQPGSNKSAFSGLRVFSRTETALSEGVDAVVIASMEDPQNEYQQLCVHVDYDRIFTAPLLHIARKTNGSGT